MILLVLIILSIINSSYSHTIVDQRNSSIPDLIRHVDNIPNGIRPLKPTNIYNTTFGGYDKNKINVHLISHTHDDVGWLKTVDQYYSGAYNTYTQGTGTGVELILDSITLELSKNKDRKFIYVETAFLNAGGINKMMLLKRKYVSLLKMAN